MEPANSELNSVEIEYFDSPLAKPLNVHNAPREPLPFTTSTASTGFRESIDLANSNTDPFQQLSAPDLTGFIPEGEKEENVQYIFASPARTKEPARTLSPFNSDALRVEEPPKVLALVPDLVEEEKEESGSFSLSSLLPSFFSSPVESVQVAGSLPITVRDPPQQNVRRPPVVEQGPPSSNQGGGILSSLFSRPTSRRPTPRPRPRPIRPDVPAQKVNEDHHITTKIATKMTTAMTTTMTSTTTMTTMTTMTTAQPGTKQSAWPLCACDRKQATWQARLHPAAHAGGRSGCSGRSSFSRSLWQQVGGRSSCSSFLPQVDNYTPMEVVDVVTESVVEGVVYCLKRSSTCTKCATNR